MPAVSIDSVDAATILDSRGAPTLRVLVRLSEGSLGVASAPSDASLALSNPFVGGLAVADG